MKNRQKQKLSVIALLLPMLVVFNASAEIANRYDKMYDDCLKKAGTINNSIVHGCSSLVSETANKDMDNLYRSIYQKISKISAEDAKTFERSHKSWIEYRDNHCGLMGSYVGSPMYSYCPMQLNKKRAEEMRELAR